MPSNAAWQGLSDLLRTQQARGRASWSASQPSAGGHLRCDDDIHHRAPTATTTTTQVYSPQPLHYQWRQTACVQCMLGRTKRFLRGTGIFSTIAITGPSLATSANSEEYPHSTTLYEMGKTAVESPPLRNK